MHEYDITLKLLLREPAGLVTRELAGPIARWLNIELPEVQNTRVDLLGETADGGLVHIELQSGNDARMALRMAEYCLRVYRLFGKFPRQVLLYVGSDPLRMDTELRGADFSFRYRLADIRDVDGTSLLESACIGDNVIAILARLGDRHTAVREVIGKLAGLEPGAREFHLRALLMLAGLRGLEEVVEEEARKMPVLNDILDNKVLGREFKKGKLEGEAGLLRLQIEARFGVVPDQLNEKLSTMSVADLEELGVRFVRAETVEDLLK